LAGGAGAGVADAGATGKADAAGGAAAGNVDAAGGAAAGNVEAAGGGALAAGALRTRPLPHVAAAGFGF
jgi:hypothetical protein